MTPRLAVDIDTLYARLDALLAVNPLPPDGACRLALTEEDREGRDLFCRWAEESCLPITVDAIGNLFATLPGAEPGLAPVMSGSHLDTVATGGRFDGALGVLAALGTLEAMRAAGFRPPRALVAAAFTNEEGARFAPDMLGSLVFAGDLTLADARAIRGVDGTRLGEELDRIGYDGPLKPGAIRPHAFVELHVEQGPVLDAQGIAIGVVEGVQGISWQEFTFAGEANHAGATPMAMRHDAGYAAAATATALRALTQRIPGLLATCGRVTLEPNLINVIPERATVTVDLRHPDEDALQEAEAALAEAVAAVAEEAGVTSAARSLARFEPVVFAPSVREAVAAAAAARGLSARPIISGAGHDAQIMARIAPSGMIFAPSIGGISHNPAEASRREDIAAAVAVLADVLTKLALEKETP